MMYRARAATHIRNFVLAAGVIILAGVVTYMIKSIAFEKQQRLDYLTARITAEQERIRVLEVDWQYLTRPDRINRLAGDMLLLSPVEAQRIITPGDFRQATGREGEAAPASTAGLYRLTIR